MAIADIDALIAQANSRIKAAAIRLRIYRKGSKLYLQGTLPPKPLSDKKKPHQQYISLGVSANPSGLKFAEAKAKEIDALLNLDRFEWSPWLRSAPDPNKMTIAEWLKRLETHYFESRPKTQASLNTFNKNYAMYIKRLPQDELLTSSMLRDEIVRGSPGGSRNRQLYCMAFGALAKFAGIELDLESLKSNYSPKSVSLRDLPTDERILEIRDRITDPAWQWLYSMMATYGLRNHEVFHLDLSQIATPPYCIEVLEGTKTGRRFVYPCLSHWPEQFELWKVNYPKKQKWAKHNNNNNEMGVWIHNYFRCKKLGIRPYDLRHAYAARTAALGVDVAIASRWMGHSVSVHTKTYHQFLNQSHNQMAWELMRERERVLSQLVAQERSP
jgi:integrase